eukprot:scaffold6312_cov58-Phaeocystis_antarctica.AAC.3
MPPTGLISLNPVSCVFSASRGQPDGPPGAVSDAEKTWKVTPEASSWRRAESPVAGSLLPTFLPALVALSRLPWNERAVSLSATATDRSILRARRLVVSNEAKGTYRSCNPSFGHREGLCSSDQLQLKL